MGVARRVRSPIESDMASDLIHVESDTNLPSLKLLVEGYLFHEICNCEFYI